MNKTLNILSGFILCAGLAAPAQAVDCFAPNSFPEARACNAARQGIDSLRRFVWRTRMIYGFYLPDFLHAVPPGR